MEEWRDIKGYEGLYQVSNLGRIKSLPKMRGFVLQESKIKNEEYSNGYVRCKLHKRRWVYDLIKKGKVQTIKLWGKQLIYIGDENR